MIVRKIDISEVPKVMRFIKQFEEATDLVIVDVDHCISKYTDLIKLGTAAIFILEDNNDIVGSLACVVGDDLHYPKTFAVETFWYVAKKFRGVGTQLLEYFESWAEERGCIPAMIHLADSFPERLEKFYEARGYKLVEKHYIKEV